MYLVILYGKLILQIIKKKSSFYFMQINNIAYRGKKPNFSTPIKKYNEFYLTPKYST